MKVWHDDIRRPPDDTWNWVRTNAQAQQLLLTEDVQEINLDHDLGLEDLDPDVANADYLIGQSLETGQDLVKWMIAEQRLPKKITIHSLNLMGSILMAELFYDAQIQVVLEPFDSAIRT